MPRLQHSLRLQITLAIAVLSLLFASSTLYSLHVIDQQRSDDILVRLAGRLQFNQQHLTLQAMRYQENAPRDYPGYWRDLTLYYEDLQKTRDELSQIIEAFAGNRFEPVLVGDATAMRPRLPRRSHAAAKELAVAWQTFLEQLDERIGPDSEEPRLESAARWIAAEHVALERIAHRLSSTLESDVAARAARANRVNRLLLFLALSVALGTAIWFYRRVLAPLSVAVEGFKQVASGDFAHKVPVTQNNEIGWLADAFNRLSERMDALRRLLTRLEQGDSLEGTLRTLSETLPPLIPVDWIGVLVLARDGQIRLEMAFSDGSPDPVGELSFRPERTLLEECIRSREPFHIADVREMAARSESYRFLRRLEELGRRDAIFLPIGSGAGIQGVAVFASRYPNNFRSEHLALLRNLGVLVGVSLGRTIQLADTHPAAGLGQFASGIVSEIQRPLRSIGFELDRLKGLGIRPEEAAGHLERVGAGIARIEGILSDIQLYAQPLALARAPQDLVELVAETVAEQTTRDRPIMIQSSPCPLVPADRDRIRQVLVNLIRNAQQASPLGSSIGIRCRPSGAGWVEVEIANRGNPIPQPLLERIFEPFFVSKQGGSGLGLPIVQRIVSAHGGEVELRSDEVDGTRAILRLPIAAAAELPGDQTTDDAGGR